MVENKNGLYVSDWHQSLRKLAQATNSGGELNKQVHQQSIDIRQTANEGDFVSPRELVLSLGVIQTISDMPETLREGVLNSEVICEYDHAGNSFIQKVVIPESNVHSGEPTQDSEIE